jgi:hypothetical protein
MFSGLVITHSIRYFTCTVISFDFVTIFGVNLFFDLLNLDICKNPLLELATGGTFGCN